MITALKQKWNVYLMEAICLGVFMVSAALFGTLLEYPNSTVHLAVSDDFARLCLMGLIMGLTALGIIYSPMGKLSGAHMNPAVTLTFLGLGKIGHRDAIFYVLFQCAGALLAVYLMSWMLGDSFKDEHVNYVVTIPGKWGAIPAFAVEVLIAFIMMSTVLLTSNDKTLSRYTGIAAGILVMLYVILSGPISGFSMNPARTIASAVPAGQYASLWIYLTAPFIGMFSAAVLYRAHEGSVRCAKMYHTKIYQCIFNCGYCQHEKTEEL